MIRYNPNLNDGLTKEQVENRIKEKLVNFNTTVPTKKIREIILTNIFTIFNLVNFLLAFAIVLVGSYKNLLFMGVVISNTIISIFQEIKAKITIDKLSIIASKKVKVIRDKTEENILLDEIVLDDIVKFSVGNQIVVDSVILDGECEVDESFITGEGKTLYKKTGDKLLSGSFIVSGSVSAKVEHIGLDNYTAKITKEAKYIKKIRSEILTSLNKLIKLAAFLIVPFGILLFLKQMSITNNLESSTVTTVAALIGMIPEGLILLTSSVFALSAIKLARKNVLVQDLYSAEILARVDTLCLDKTGTITEGVMELKEVITLNSEFNIDEIISNLVYSFKETNQTLKAIKNKYKKNSNYKVEEIVSFSSEKKWSGIKFKEGSFLIGAPEILIKDKELLNKYKSYISEYRVLMLGYCKNGFKDKNFDVVEPLALIVIQDKIRKEAKNIISYFLKQNVDIKIISGDSPTSVSTIALKCGIPSYDSYIDLSRNKDINYDEIVKKYTIFARVSPSEKKELILALKRNGKTVAMTGDGVNDVLALKEADISIALKEGADATRNVSNIVLLDSDFSHVLEALLEGRQAINNLERSSSLFLVKTIFSALLTIIFLFLNMPYPFIPIQLTLTSMVTIGIPSFILALEENNNLVKGKFLTNVISAALPAALTIVINILIIVLFSKINNLSIDASSTMCVLSNAVIGFLYLYKISKPFNILRKFLFVSMVLLFIIQIYFLNDIYSLVMLNLTETIFIISLLLLSTQILKIFNKIYEYSYKKHSSFFN